MQAKALTQDYFPYFNTKLYETLLNSPEELSEEKCYSKYTNDSSTNESFNTLDSIDEDQEKLIPFNLLDLSQIEDCNNSNSENKSSKQNEIKTMSQEEGEKMDKDKLSGAKNIKKELKSFQLPKDLFSSSQKKKNKVYTYAFKPLNNFGSNFSGNLNIYNMPFNMIQMYPNTFKFKNKNGQKLKKKNCVKKEFVEREGDWPCYKCKNINFSFRKQCNKCRLNKEESEKMFQEVGEKLLRLVDVSNSNK